MVQRDLREPKLFMMVFGNPLNSHLTFMNRLRQRLSYGEGTSIEESDVIIAFVAISSRAGTDIEAALQEIPQGLAQSIFLVVLHHTFDENWVIPDSRRCVNRRNVFTVDCLFHEDLGFLRCQSNDEAVRAVTAHLISKGVPRKLVDVYYPAGPANLQISPENKVILSVIFEVILGGFTFMIIGYCGPIPGLFIGILGGFCSGYFHHIRSKRPKPLDRLSEPLIQDRTHNPQI
ncbi:uncharacterized protein LOC111189860 isoform X1 [Astyanax mexicanus]|uniref:uncharacterized protein LOC111189860 isoform X1 n=1 Tax=Astyanax mexicanus TaxID=7994 RepID=UPI0020CABEDE|nr:uncharacterized protein LOC111189860 isoform X1 [Astyanax mexicanus]